MMRGEATGCQALFSQWLTPILTVAPRYDSCITGPRRRERRWLSTDRNTVKPEPRAAQGNPCRSAPGGRILLKIHDIDPERRRPPRSGTALASTPLRLAVEPEGAMGTRLSGVALWAVLAGGCGSGSDQPAAGKVDALALVTVRPTTAASLTASRLPRCAWCTTAFGADLTVESDRALADVNLWLDGWSGTKRCLYSQHDSPADGFAL